MKRKFLIPLSFLVLILIIAGIYFAMVQRTDFYGPVAIKCNDTAELTYTKSNTRLMVTVLKNCGTLNIETLSDRGVWEKLTETSPTLGTPIPVNFDSGYIAVVDIPAKNKKIRFICFNGERDSCKFEIIDFDAKRTSGTRIYTSLQNFPCSDTVSTHIYNFSNGRVPMTLNINWTSVCAINGVGSVAPEIYERPTNARLPVKVKTADKGDAASPYKAQGYLLRGPKELLIKCPGNVAACSFYITLVKN